MFFEIQSQPRGRDLPASNVASLFGLQARSLFILGTSLAKIQKAKDLDNSCKIIQDSKDLEAAKQILSNNLYRLERFKPHQWEILKHLANAAARIGEYKEAKRLFKESLFLQGNSKNLITKEVMDLKSAKEALEDLRNLLEANEIQMFLVSGTFLGCVREHNFISYDKDIDVGIYKQDLQKAREVLQKSKNFKLNTLFKNYQGGVQIRHLNNTYIDVLRIMRSGGGFITMEIMCGGGIHLLSLHLMSFWVSNI